MTDDSRPQADFPGEMIEHLREAGVAPGLEIGTSAPHFVLSDAGGGKLSLDDKLADGPVVLSFYRGAWCVRARHVDANYRERMQPEAIIAALEALAD